MLVVETGSLNISQTQDFLTQGSGAKLADQMNQTL